MKDFISGITLVLFSLAIKFQSVGYDRTKSSDGPFFWPNIISSLLILVGLCIAIRGVYMLRSNVTENKLNFKIPESVKKRLIPVLISLVIYVIAVKYLGFLIATPIFQAVFMYILIRKRKWIILWLPAVLTSVLFIIFVKGMYVILPRGVGAFRVFSRLFY